MSSQITSFKISRYILFALVLVLCIWMILWVLKSKEIKNTSTDSTVNVMHITADNKVQKI